VLGRSRTGCEARMRASPQVARYFCVLRALARASSACTRDATMSAISTTSFVHCRTLVGESRVRARMRVLNTIDKRVTTTNGTCNGCQHELHASARCRNA
jgi:hypothetical protein